MVELRKNELTITNGLEHYLSTPTRECKVIRQNQTANTPAYPYVTYSIPTPIAQVGGTYSEADDGTQYRTIQQTWSFTVQSDDQDEALRLAIRIHSFFTSAGTVYLADKDISVYRVGGIATRDTLLSIEYEHRNGLDVTFGLLDKIEPDEFFSAGTIDQITFKEV